MLRRGATIAAALLAVLLAQRSAGQVAPRSALEDASATADSRQLDIGAGGFVTLTSVLPLPAQESIVVKDMKGTVVRTLVNESRPAGVYADKWDGKGDGGRRLKDDQYRWVATFTTGGHTFTIDRSNELDGDFELKSHQDYPSWDPFRGLPLRFSVTFERPGEIVLIFSRATSLCAVTLAVTRRPVTGSAQVTARTRTAARSSTLLSRFHAFSNADDGTPP